MIVFIEYQFKVYQIDTGLFFKIQYITRCQSWKRHALINQILPFKFIAFLVIQLLQIIVSNVIKMFSLYFVHNSPDFYSSVINSVQSLLKIKNKTKLIFTKLYLLEIQMYRELRLVKKPTFITCYEIYYFQSDIRTQFDKVTRYSVKSVNVSIAPKRLIFFIL